VLNLVSFAIFISKNVSEAKISVGRIQNFLESPELSSNEVPLMSNIDEGAIMVVSRATSHWNSSCVAKSTPVASLEETSSAMSLGYSSSSDDIESKSNEPGSNSLLVALKNVNLRFDAGTLTCIIGEVRMTWFSHYCLSCHTLSLTRYYLLALNEIT